MREREREKIKKGKKQKVVGFSSSLVVMGPVGPISSSRGVRDKLLFAYAPLMALSRLSSEARLLATGRRVRKDGAWQAACRMPFPINGSSH
jgi:hypothetical protein